MVTLCECLLRRLPERSSEEGVPILAGIGQGNSGFEESWQLPIICRHCRQKFPKGVRLDKKVWKSSTPNLREETKSGTWLSCAACPTPASPRPSAHSTLVSSQIPGEERQVTFSTTQNHVAAIPQSAAIATEPISLTTKDGSSLTTSSKSHGDPITSSQGLSGLQTSTEIVD